MNLSVFKKRPGAIATARILWVAIWQNLQARLKEWAPVGYQNETGFHLGIEDRLEH